MRGDSLRWQCRQASPTLAGNASHALLAQLCADGTAAVARDAYYALLQQECVARSAEPHSGACHALLRQQSLGRTATWPRVRAGHIDLRSSGIYTSSPAAPWGAAVAATHDTSSATAALWGAAVAASVAIARSNHTASTLSSSSSSRCSNSR